MFELLSGDVVHLYLASKQKRKKKKKKRKKKKTCIYLKYFCFSVFETQTTFLRKLNCIVALKAFPLKSNLMFNLSSAFRFLIFIKCYRQRHPLLTTSSTLHSNNDVNNVRS